MIPLISVIIPTFNYARYITEAIASVLRQDYPKDKIEIIVVDDGSTDNTKEVLNGLIQNNTIEYFFQQNQGKAAATYKAIGQATGKYIFNLDADDYYLPGKIKHTVAIFESDESIVHVASPAQVFDQEKNEFTGIENLPAEISGTKKNGIEILQYFYRGNVLYGGGSTYVARSSVIKKISIPAEADMYIDEFLILAVLPFGKTYFIKNPLSVWRVHASNYSNITYKKNKAQRLLKSSLAVLDYLEKNNFDSYLIKIYKLKNSNRVMAFKEAEKTKSISDILAYAKEVFFNIKPGWEIIKNYQVLNRLVPLPLFLFLKKIKH